ncbi:ABC transporter ATP-binding protein [bacterium]|nr:ABC transporter ATP-binding protein [candidate division CSSED10-310 bacterium]
MQFIVDCKTVGIQFRRYQEKNRMLRWAVIDSVRKRQKHEKFWALHDVSFTVKQGETFGIIGENGSGKSTLLKLLTGIIKPDLGSISVKGKISALLELGAGFQPDLTGRENIFLNGSIMGLSRDEIIKRFDEIVGFSELEKFVDTPIKHYSSGMYMRLGFSIAINVDPDILLIDEVLAVGDQSFQQKCMDKIRDFKRKGKTIIFVSHDLTAVGKLCSRAIWLNFGKVAARGTVQRVIDFYRQNVQDQEEARLKAEHEDSELELEQRWGSRVVEINKVEFLDEFDQKQHQFRTGDPFRVRIAYQAHSRIEKPVFGIAIHRNDGTHVNGPNTKFANTVPEYIEGKGAVYYEIKSLPLLPGTYYFTAVVYNYECNHPYDHHDQMFPFQVIPGCTEEEYGVVWIPSTWRYEGNHGKIIS